MRADCETQKSVPTVRWGFPWQPQQREDTGLPSLLSCCISLFSLSHSFSLLSLLPPPLPHFLSATLLPLFLFAQFLSLCLFTIFPSLFCVTPLSLPVCLSLSPLFWLPHSVSRVIKDCTLINFSALSRAKCPGRGLCVCSGLYYACVLGCWMHPITRSALFCIYHFLTSVSVYVQVSVFMSVQTHNFYFYCLHFKVCSS